MTAQPRNDTTWMHEGRLGVFIHFLADGASCTTASGLDPEAWQRRVDTVDVDRLAGHAAEAGARWVGLTIGQNSGFCCSPNAAWDALVDERPSRLSRRDLIADLADACARRGLRTMAYLPSHAPALHRRAAERMACTPAWDASAWQLRPGTYLQAEGVDERLTRFQRNWEGIIAEWSRRWGPRVHAWWIDGCYHADRMYRHDDGGPGYRSFAAALRAGNPQALVAFNTGVRTPIVSATPFEDYTAGELSSDLPLTLWTRKVDNAPAPPERFVDGAQYHQLNHLGTYWGRGTPRFSDALAAGYSAYVTGFGGAVTWDVPMLPDGAVPDLFRRQLAAIRAAIGA